MCDTQPQHSIAQNQASVGTSRTVQALRLGSGCGSWEKALMHGVAARSLRSGTCLQHCLVECVRIEMQCESARRKLCVYSCSCRADQRQTLLPYISEIISPHAQPLRMIILLLHVLSLHCHLLDLCTGLHPFVTPLSDCGTLALCRHLCCCPFFGCLLWGRRRAEYNTHRVLLQIH